MKKMIPAALVLLSQAIGAQTADDQYQWLEEVEGQKPLEFVEQHNKRSIEKLMQVKGYQEIYDKALEQYNSDDRIVYPAIYGEFVYNFWQDKTHVRGIWRRTPKASYYDGTPVWETLLDLDEMSAKDGAKWVYKGSSGLYPKYEKFMVRLSRGGGDAVVCREYDAVKKTFVKDGFTLPEAKGGASWLDENTLIVSTDFGKGSLTTSGYPRQAKLWKRGTPLADAKLIFEGNESDVSSGAYVLRDGDKQYLAGYQALTFYTQKSFVWQNDKRIDLPLPEDAEINDILSNQLLFSLRKDWTVNGKTYKAGTLLSANFTDLLSGTRNIRVVVEPDEFSSLNSTATTRNKLLVNMLNNVKSELYVYSFSYDNWQKQKINAPDMGSILLNATDEFSDDFFFTYTNFLTPTTLYSANAANNTFKPFKSLPSYFDASKYKVEQFRARSKDGTLIPYFMVSRKDLKYDGQNPTLLYAYGGFEVSLFPYYSGITGTAWLERGGVYVLANIRGGGEYGPRWHQAGLKENRQNIYNDFHSVAEDLAARKVADSKHLGIMGGSNGGLLMGVAVTQRPELYKAVVCAVPLLDMKRYNKLLAGASWMGEYGDPDKPEDWEYMSKYSPYQNLKTSAKYPEVFFTTSTRDDRVHPGHARKMVAKMTDMGYTVYYYENTEGGHAGSSTNEQRAKASALQYSYLLMKLRDENMNLPKEVKD